MDYPPPLVTINSNDEIDLSNAYTNEIGDWDKYPIRLPTISKRTADEAVALKPNSY
jgi:hypothetical protein